jgi:hypothetical protein
MPHGLLLQSGIKMSRIFFVHQDVLGLFSVHQDVLGLFSVHQDVLGLFSVPQDVLGLFFVFFHGKNYAGFY